MDIMPIPRSDYLPWPGLPSSVCWIPIPYAVNRFRDTARNDNSTLHGKLAGYMYLTCGSDVVLFL